MSEMEMKKLHMGTAVFGWDAMDEISHLLSMVFAEGDTFGECYIPRLN